MRVLGEPIKNGDAVQLMIMDYIHPFGGVAIVENGELIRVDQYNNKGSIDASLIHTIALNVHDIDVQQIVRQELLIETAQKYEFEYYNGPELHDIKSDMISHTAYQRALFEMNYYPKEHLDYVNFFAPSACYYPVGWYNLGGEQSEIGDEYGEKVDAAWQTWRTALQQNKYHGNITAKEITYKGI